MINFFKKIFKIKETTIYISNTLYLKKENINSSLLSIEEMEKVMKSDKVVVYNDKGENIVIKDRFGIPKF